MFRNSKQKGSLSESKIMAALISAGYSISIPFGDYLRYDLIADDGAHLYKVQCKTARLKSGYIEFNTVSNNIRTGQSESYSENQIDFFAVYCREIDKCFLLPVSLVTSKKKMRLRLSSSKNNQEFGIVWASQFEIKGV